MLEHAHAAPDVNLPDQVREMGVLYLDQINRRNEVIEGLAELDRRSK